MRGPTAEELAGYINALVRRALKDPGKDKVHQEAAIQDAVCLQQKLCQHIAAITTGDRTALQEVLHLAAMWKRSLWSQLCQCGRTGDMGRTIEVIPPYMRIPWRVQQKARHPLHLPGDGKGLNLATFGWWEIASPTLENYARLEAQLIGHQVHVCTVTGMPVQGIVQAIQDLGRYRWHGPVTDNHQGVGHLVHVSLWNTVKSVSPPEACGTRVVVTKIGAHTVQGVYSPYVGKIPTKCHKAFLSAVLDNHAAHQSLNEQATTWTSGDLNLQGIAPGQKDRPKPGSKQQMMSAWMTQALKAYELEVVKTPITHVRGSALDVHITRAAGRFEARVRYRS